MPVDKNVRLSAAADSETFHLLNNENICLAGTSVSAGNGRAVVVSTGKDTYMAAIAQELKKKRPENAIQMGIRKVSYVLMGFMLVSKEFCFLSSHVALTPPLLYAFR
jgi:Mg2+-importing ATPase